MRLPSSIDHPVYHAVAVPFVRLWESSALAKIAGLLGVVLQVLWSDAFTVFFCLAFLSAIVDTVYGRRLHKLIGDYDPLKAEIGLHGKFAGLAIGLFFRAMEWAMTNRVLIEAGDALSWASSRGLIATAIVGTLLVQDLDSIQEKRERFGQPPIPVFSAGVRLIRKAVERLAGVPENPTLRDRRSSDEPSRIEGD